MARLLTCTLFLLLACGDEPTEPSNMLPVGEISSPAMGLTIHQGETVRFDATCSDPDGNTPVSHSWDFGDDEGSVERAPAHAFNTAGSFSVQYRCTDALGGTSAVTRRDIVVTNEAPVVEAMQPMEGLSLLPGTMVTAGLTCSDADDPDMVTGTITLDDVEIPSGEVELNEAGTYTFEAICTDVHGLSARVARDVVVGGPMAVYLSTENQLDHRQLMWSGTPGSPAVLNQPLFAPGGGVQQVFIANGDVYYTADHSVEGRSQLYRANPAAPESPLELTTPVVRSGPSSLTTDASGERFFYLAEQSVATQSELFWVDATAETPVAVGVTPFITSGQEVQETVFSPGGRYLGFRVIDRSTNLYSTYIVDLDSGDPAVALFSDETDGKVTFSADDRYALVATRTVVHAVDLDTLGAAAPVQVDLLESDSRIEEFAFVQSSSLAAIVASPPGSSVDVLRVVDVAAAIEGVGQLNEIVYDATEVDSSLGSALVHVCGDEVYFAATSDFASSLYHVNLSDWAADFRAAPGSEASPHIVHSPLTEGEQIYTHLVTIADDCSALAYLALRDDDDDPGTASVSLVQYTAASDLGTSETIASVGDFRTGGQYPDFAFSPDAQHLTWTVSDDENRQWVSSVSDPAPLLVAETLVGRVDEYVWLDNEQLLVRVASSDDAGLYIWDRTQPNDPVQVSPGVPNLNQFHVSDDGQSVVYRELIGGEGQVTEVGFAAPEVGAKLNGDGSTNGAEIHRSWLVNDGSLVLFAAEQGVDGQIKLFAVNPDTPGEVTEVFPGDAARTATTSILSVQYIAATQSLVFQAARDGVQQVFTAGLSPITAPRSLELGSVTMRALMAVAPDGEHVMFRGVEDDIDRVYVQPVDGEPVAVFEGVALHNGISAFSPMGRYCAFQVGRSPGLAYVVDTQNLAAGAVPLLDESFPLELPRNAESATPSATTGVTQVGFGPGDEWIYFAYDDTYSRNLKLVRRPLSDLQAEVVLSAPTDDSERIELWSFPEGGESVVYRRAVFPDGPSGASTTALVSVDPESPGVERTLSPPTPGDRGVVSYELFGAYAVMHTDAADERRSLYVAPIDGSTLPWRATETLASETNLGGLGVTEAGGTLALVYTAHQVGDERAQLYVARQMETSIARTRFDLGDQSPTARTSADGQWLFWQTSRMGVSEGLSVTALAAPGAQLQLSGMPIENGTVGMPDGVR